MIKLNINLPHGWMDSETRDDYVVTAEVKELWSVLLDLLVQVDNLCKKHCISYFICGGTLLGAVRHKGFIPWDDDLDIMMDRNNYNHFIQVAKNELRSPYFLQTEDTDPGCLYRFAKVRNSLTTGIENKPYYIKNKKINQGIFIDIFCLDKIPDNSSERALWFNGLYKIWGEVWKLGAYENRFIKRTLKDHLTTGIKLLLLRLLKKRNYYNRKFEILASKYKDSSTLECCHIAGTLRKNCMIDKKYIWKCKDYNQFIEADFEFLHLPMPQNYEQQLSALYGNWHKKVIGQNSHGELIIDTNNSYKTFFHNRESVDSSMQCKAT